MMAVSGMRDAFPHTALWLAEYQGILMGSDAAGRAREALERIRTRRTVLR